MALEYGVLAAFITALFFASNSIVLRRGVLSGYAYSGTLISILIGVPMYLTCSIFLGEYNYLYSVPIEYIALFVLIGLLHFAIGRYLYYLSVHYSGTVVSMPIMASGQIIAAYLGILILSETITLIKITGLILTTLGFISFIMVSEDVKMVRRSLILSSISAFIFAVTTLLIRYGFTYARLPILGVLISYTTVLPVYLGLLLRENARDELFNINKYVLIYLIISAVLVNLGQLFKYVALNLAEVSVVGPIISTEIILNLVFSAIINRRYEIINYNTVLGSIAIFLGIVAVII
jgi:uncharacterized membrane protein